MLSVGRLQKQGWCDFLSIWGRSQPGFERVVPDVMERSKKISGKVNEEKNELVTLPDESKRKGSEGRGLRAVKGISSDKL